MFDELTVLPNILYRRVGLSFQNKDTRVYPYAASKLNRRTAARISFHSIRIHTRTWGHYAQVYTTTFWSSEAVRSLA